MCRVTAAGGLLEAEVVTADGQIRVANVGRRFDHEVGDAEELGKIVNTQRYRDSMKAFNRFFWAPLNGTGSIALPNFGSALDNDRVRRSGVVTPAPGERTSNQDGFTKL